MAQKRPQQNTKNSNTTKKPKIDDNNTPTLTKDNNNGAQQPQQSEAEEGEQWELNPCFTYLEQWKKDRIRWKFNKNHQNRLMRHWKDHTKFSKAHFKLFMEYIVPIRGNSRLHLFNDAKRLMREQKAKVSKDAIAYVNEFMEPKDRKKYENMSEEEKNAQLLKTLAARKFMESELSDNTVYKRARAVYDILVLTDEEHGSALADESGEDDDDGEDGGEQAEEETKEEQAEK